MRFSNKDNEFAQTQGGCLSRLSMEPLLIVLWCLKLSILKYELDLSDNITDSTSETSDSYSDDDEIDTDIEEQLCTLEHERQKILKKLKKFELEKKRKKMKKKLKIAKEKKKLKKKKKVRHGWLSEKSRLSDIIKIKKAKTKKKKRKKESSSSDSDSSSDSESNRRSKKNRRKRKRKKSSSSSSSISTEDATSIASSNQIEHTRHDNGDTIVIQESGFRQV